MKQIEAAHTVNRRAALAVSVVGIALIGSAPAKAAELGAWDTLPLPASVKSCAVGMEPGGAPWISTGNELLYWDGNGFRPVANDPQRPWKRTGTFVGGSDCDLYMATSPTSALRADLYRLSDGTAKHVTKYYAEPGTKPGLYVSRSGRLFNYGQRFVAVYADGEWKRIEAPLSRDQTLIFETADAVHFYYNGELCSVDADNRMTQRCVEGATQSVAGQRTVCGTLWGENRMVLYQTAQKGVQVVDLRTGTRVETDAISNAIGQNAIWRILSDPRGLIWVLWRPPGEDGYRFTRIWPDGRIEHMPETEKLHWGGGAGRDAQEKMLCASDGSVWFALHRGGIARVSDGKVQLFDWRQGLFITARQLWEGPGGTVYAAMVNRIARYRPDVSAPPPPPELARWDAFEVASRGVLRDCNGNVWLFLKDHPGQMSRWQDGGWHHISVPFDTTKVNRTIADDRGHLIIQMNAHPDGCYDVSLEGAVRYDDISEALVAALADGAEHFEPDEQFAGCRIVDCSGIWFGYQNYRHVQYYDGDRWDSLSVGDDIWHIYESDQYGVLLRTQGWKYYAYERGQLVEVASLHDQGTVRWLFGPRGFQPFEASLLSRSPSLYVAVERDPQNPRQFYMLQPRPDAADPLKPAESFVRRDALPFHVSTATGGFHYSGYWTSRMGPNANYRVFGGRCFLPNYIDTPLTGKDVRQVVEDGEHNLWFETGTHSVFVQRLGTFTLQLDPTPVEVKRALRIRARSDLPGLGRKDLRVFYRIDGGPWQGGDPGAQPAIEFDRSGDYTVELVGMELLGGTTPVIKAAIRATVPLPETTLLEDAPEVLRDVVWSPPVNLVPSEPSAQPYLTYRIDEGLWAKVTDGQAIPVAALSPGKHVIELAAMEGQRYRDPTPIRVAFRYEPDYAFIVSSRLAELSSTDLMVAEKARLEIMLAGPEVLPALERELDAAREACKRVYVLERTQRELKAKASADKRPPTMR